MSMIMSPATFISIRLLELKQLGKSSLLNYGIQNKQKSGNAGKKRGECRSKMNVPVDIILDMFGESPAIREIGAPVKDINAAEISSFFLIISNR